VINRLFDLMVKNVKKKIQFWRCHFIYYEPIILPRQARDKHSIGKGHSQKRCVFSQVKNHLLSPEGTLQGGAGVRKRHFLAVFILKRSFDQDRLGTNIGKTQKKPVFSQQQELAEVRKRLPPPSLFVFAMMPFSCC
jgi:hypothetical protein